LIAIIIGVALFGCRAQRNLQSDDIDVSRIMEAEGITFWFDVYDPLSYAINFNNDILRIVLYTHHLNSNKLVIEEHISADKASLDLFKKLNMDYYKECEAQSGYICSGLDGSETWIQFEKNEETIVRKYWSPEDQVNIELGMNLHKLQKELSNNLKISQLKAVFMANLKRGKYWNYGPTQLIK